MERLKRKDFGGGYQQNFPCSSSKKVYFTPLNPIPPLTQSEYEGLVIDYLTCNPEMKIDSLTLQRNIQDNYKIYDNSIYVFKTFSINDIIRDLHNHDLIDIKEINIGLKRAYFIIKIHEQRLKKYKADNLENFVIRNTIDIYNAKSKQIAINYLSGNFQDSTINEYIFHSMYSNDDKDISNLAGINNYKYK